MLQFSQKFCFKDFTLALKDDLRSIKSEISSEEQFLENMIRGERFFHKYFKLIVSVVVVLVVAFCVYKFIEYKKEAGIISANESYQRLSLNMPQKDDIDILKQNAPSLYALYALSDTNSSVNLQDLKNLKGIDPLLVDLIKFKIDKSNNALLTDYTALLKGFELIKSGDLKKADVEFAKIPLDSNLQKIVKNLKHYSGTQK